MTNNGSSISHRLQRKRYATVIWSSPVTSTVPITGRMCRVIKRCLRVWEPGSSAYFKWSHGAQKRLIYISHNGEVKVNKIWKM